MNVMVVGGGGREHAIIKALKKNPAITTLYATPETMASIFSGTFLPQAI